MIISPPSRTKNKQHFPQLHVKAWAAATNAPVDRDPLRGMAQQQQRHQHERQQQQQQQQSLLSPSDFSLVLRPDIASDEHLMSIHESPWTPDGKVWFQAKISLLQVAPQTAEPEAAATAKVTPTRGRHLPRGHINIGNGDRGGGGRAAAGGGGARIASRRGRERRGARADKKASGVVPDQAIGGGAGLSVTLRPEGAGQRRARLEREAAMAMALEDERSRRVGRGVSRLYKEASGRAEAVEEARRLSRLALAACTAKVCFGCTYSTSEHVFVYTIHMSS